MHGTMNINYHLPVPLSWNLGTLTSWKPYGSLQACNGTALPIYINKIYSSLLQWPKCSNSIHLVHFLMPVLGPLFFVKEENIRIKSQYFLFTSIFKFGISWQIFMKFSVKVMRTKASLNPSFLNFIQWVDTT